MEFVSDSVVVCNPLYPHNAVAGNAAVVVKIPP